MATIAKRTHVAAWVVAFFVRPRVRQYEKPIAMATLLWTLWVWHSTGRPDPNHLAICAGIAFLALVRRLAYSEANKLPERYYAAFARSDAEEMAALSKLFRLFHPDGEERKASELTRLGEEMIVRKRWADAHAALAQVDLRLFPSHSRAVVLNNLAYVTARNGDPTKALEIIEKAYAEGDKSPGEKMIKALPSLRGTHGIALFLAGRYEEALPLLELGAEEGTDRSRNERLYWFGRVLRMLGRDDEARVAFAKAIDLGGPCTDEARTELAEGTPFRG